MRDLLKREDGKDLTYGGVAQLGEHLPCKQGVMGSNPIISIPTWVVNPNKTVVKETNVLNR